MVDKAAGSKAQTSRHAAKLRHAAGAVKQKDSRPLFLPSFFCPFHRSLKEECLERMIFFGEESSRKAVVQFLEHYHQERNHQGLGNRLVEPRELGQETGEVQCRERLGGILKFYYRKAS